MASQDANVSIESKHQPMKRIVIATGVLLLAGTMQAASLNANFQTTVSFTSTCIAAASAPTLAFGNYTAFGAAVSATAVNVSFNCSRNTAIVAAGLNTAAPNANGSFGLFPLNNLNYLLTLTGPNTTSGASASAAFGNIGGADVYTYAVGGTLPQQAGKYSSAPVAESVTRSVVLVF